MSPRSPWLSSLTNRLAASIRQVLAPRPSRARSGQDPTPGRDPKTRPAKSRSKPGTAKSGVANPQPGNTAHTDEASPGRFGPDATTEIDPHRIGPVHMAYFPLHDGDPDPGEIVWTWVPYQENDGRGKDRPVLVVATEQASDRRPDTVLAVQLTSTDRSGIPGFVAIGAGSWDGEHRPSWVNIDRVMRVHARGMRREAAALDEKNYDRVEAALRQRYGWK